MPKKTIVYAGNFCVPDGNAAGKRVFANGIALRAYGYDVVFWGVHFGNEKKKQSSIDNIKSISLKYSNGVSRLFDSYYFKEFVDLIENENAEGVVAAVILYSAMGTMRFNLKVIRYCKKKNIKVLYDFTDYNNRIDKNSLFKYLIKRLDISILKNYVLKKVDGVIAISSFGKAFSQNPSSVIIPPLVLFNEKRIPDNMPDKIVFAYASVINEKNRCISEWKDRIDSIIDAFYYVKLNGYSGFKVLFIGFSEAVFLQMLKRRFREGYKKKIEFLGENIEFLGVLSNKTTQKVISGSHYTVLLRNSMISTNVGFPTKVSESFSLKVPVISNLTSDIGDYLSNGKTGFLVDDPDHIDHLASQLIDIINLSKPDYLKMVECLNDQDPFYYDNYKNVLGDFINSL